MTFVELLDITGKVIAVFLAVGGAIAFALRSYIVAWIKSKFETEVGKQLASHKHGLDRELEAYRNALVRELEQLKANIDLRRAIELQVASRKLEALATLYSAFNEFTNIAASYTALAPTARATTTRELHERTNEARNAIRAAEIHLPLDIRTDLTNLLAGAYALAVSFVGKEERLPPDDKRLVEFRKTNIRIDGALRKEVEDMGLKPSNR